MEDERTLAQVIFSKENAKGNDYFAKHILTANSIEEIEKELFVLKLHTEPSSVAAILEIVFSNLVMRDFDLMLGDWNQISKHSKYNSILAKRCREEIGAMALEVFFEAVFERDREGFWQYIPDNDRLISLPRSMMGERFELYPQTLCVYLNYLAACNEATKAEHKNKIRKFLRFVLDEPLVVAAPPTSASRFGTSEFSDRTLRIGISDWTEGARRELAKALVANGMYEECIDYGISEAYQVLVGKFLGGSKELNGLNDNTLVDLMTPEEAMAKACEDKEWAHMWSVITRMAYKSGQAKFVRIIDPNDPRVSSGATNAPLKLSLRFENTLEKGMNGF